jgi:drug/metabolite transporter (DMT)-like permease
MDAAVLFGLLSALGYGVTDYLSRIAGRAVGVWRSLFWGDLPALALLSLGFVGHTGAWRFSFAEHPAAWCAAIVSGVILLASAAALTRGLMGGTLAVVAPVAASYGAITALLSAAAGERLSGNAMLGIAVTVIGVCAVSIPVAGKPVAGTPASARPGFKEHARASGLGWALAAALGYGVGFWLQGAYAVPSLGPFVPAWLSYAIAVGLLALLHRPFGISMAFPRRHQLAPVVATGLFSVAAFVALTLGLVTGRVAIVVVLSTLASAVTVVMSKVIDKARVAIHQWLAIAAIVGGLVLIRS